MLITGVSGAVFAPLMIRLFRVKNPVAQGVAIGTCSHAVGTSKAIELGELQGAMSGIAIGVAGLLTRSVERCPAPEDCFAGALPLRAYGTGVLSPALPPKRRVGQPVFAPGRSFLGTYSLS